MKLIRRKRKPTPAQKALDIARTGVRGLVAVRLARTAFKTYRFARRLPLLIGLGAAGAIGAAVVRKLRSGDELQTETWSPAATSTGSTPAGTGAAASASAPAAAAQPSPAPELTPNPAQTAGTGTPPVGDDDAGAPPPQAPADADVAAAGTADAQPADEDAATAGETPESTELDVEGPNESAPGHHPDEAEKT